ncbi:MAG: hypothetical protein HZB53_07200 [Chloroflexi bacterium]|nr:hypothetical protein [Chloroflexota bacterium]
MTTLLAIDLGTSFLKGAVLDLDALSITHLQRLPFPDPVGGLPDLFCEIDVERVIDATRTLIRALLPNAPGCEGIVACGQMGGLVLSDRDGAPLSNYISWRDQRLLMPHPSRQSTYWDRFARMIDDVDSRQLGREVRPGLPVSFLYWLRERGELPANAAIAASLPDFVLGRLCGARPATDITNAVGAVNVESGDWHHDLFERLGLGSIGWPVLGDVRTVVGTLEIDGRRLTCYAPAGDHQTALAGAFIAPGELSINRLYLK